LLRKLALLPLAGLIALNPTLSRAQTGTFEVSQNRTVVGTSNFTVKATAKGYDSSSIVRISMQGLSYSLSKTESLDASNRPLHVLLSGIVNGSAVNITAKPAGGQFLLNISANGRSSTAQLAAHPNSVVLPDFDAGALETLLVMAAQQNNRNLWAIIPKQAGSIASISLATYADLQGTYEGKPVTVHHLVATIGNQTTDLFSGPENQLLQAELRQEGFALVRKGFVLTPPAKPGAPPSAPASTPPATQ
jgi:hypothetical protein